MLISPLKLELWTMQNLSEFRPVRTGSHFHVFDRIMRSGPNQKLLPFRAESKCFNNHGGVITVEVSARKKWKPGIGCGCGSDCMTSSLVPASGLQVAAVLCKMFLRLDLFFLLSFFLSSTRRGFLRMDWLRFDCQASSRSQIRMRVCERKREREAEAETKLFSPHWVEMNEILIDSLCFIRNEKKSASAKFNHEWPLLLLL